MPVFVFPARRMILFPHLIGVGVFAGVVCGPRSVCLAQAPAPLSVPASLLVNDRFARAVKNQSSGPSYLMATIVNDATGETKRVCIEGIQLFEAVRLQNNGGRGWGGSRENWDKAKRFILDNTARTYHFTNPEAWQAVQPRYSASMLSKVEEQFRPLSTAELARRFDDKITGGIVSIEGKTGTEVFDYCAAAAYVLTERGLYVGRGDFGNSLYVITPQMLADDEKQRQKYAEEERRQKADGRLLAIHLPGFAMLSKTYNVKYAEVREFQPGLCFSATLWANKEQTISFIDWLNPINLKTHKARYNWTQFLPIAAHAERLAEQFPWLQAWKKAGGNRTIEAQMYGKNLHSEDEEEVRNEIVPVWKDAGLVGKPYCELTLRWRETKGKGTTATVYLPLPGSGESRCLIVSNGQLPLNASLIGAEAHWLDGLSFHSYSFAKLRQCVVVTPGGEWKLLTLPPRRPAPKTNQPVPKEPKK